MEVSHVLILYQNKLFSEGLESILQKNRIIVSKVSFNELTNLGLLKPNFKDELLLIETNWPFSYLDRLIQSHNYWNENGNKTIIIPNIINKSLVKIIQNSNIDGIVLISGDTEELFFAIKQVLEGKNITLLFCQISL